MLDYYRLRDNLTRASAAYELAVAAARGCGHRKVGLVARERRAATALLAADRAMTTYAEGG